MDNGRVADGDRVLATPEPVPVSAHSGDAPLRVLTERAVEILADHGLVDGFNLPMLPGYAVHVDPGAVVAAVATALAEPAAGVPRKPQPSLIDPAELVRKLRACANGMRSFKSDRGDYGICDDAADAIEWADWQRTYAIQWANRSVDSVKEHMWRAEDVLRDMVAMLANTGFHNSIPMAAARKLLASDSDGSGEADKPPSGLAVGDSAGRRHRPDDGGAEKGE